MQKKRILFLCPEYPFPTNSGGKVAHLNHINALIELGYSIKVVFLNTEESFEQNKESIKQEIFRAACPRNKYLRILRYYYNIFLTTLPRTFFLRQLPDLQESINRHINSGNYDTIVFDHLNAFSFKKRWPTNKNIKYVYIAHNIESKLSHDEYNCARSTFQKLILFLDYLKVSYFERKLILLSDAVITISSHDYDIINTKYKEKRLINVPELIPLKDNGWSYNGSKNIVFIGSTLHFPNYLAVQWLINILMPELSSIDKQIKLSIIGNSDNYVNEALLPNSIVFEGMVSDEKLIEICCRSSLFISPVVHGSGTKVKVLQAASLAMPILGTDESLLGNDFLDKELFSFNINSLSDTVQRIFDILNSESLQKTMSENIKVTLTHAWQENKRLWQSSTDAL